MRKSIASFKDSQGDQTYGAVPQIAPTTKFSSFSGRHIVKKTSLYQTEVLSSDQFVPDNETSLLNNVAEKNGRCDATLHIVHSMDNAHSYCRCRNINHLWGHWRIFVVLWYRLSMMRWEKMTYGR